MKHSSLLFLFIILISVLLSAGCLDESNENPVIITDMLGREVKVPKNPQRIIGLEAGALRLLVYMQHTDKVVGIEENEKMDVAGGMAKPYIFANPELKELPSIGPMHGGDAELIVAADPDVIFWTYTDSSKADDLQEKTNIPVVALKYGDLNSGKQDLFDSLDMIGDVMGNPERALEVQEFMEGRITILDNLTADLGEGPTTYVGGIGYRGAHGILSTEPSYSSLEFVNGNNVASSLGLDHAFIDKEKLLEWDPEVILIDQGGVDISMDEIGEGIYDSIDAVSTGRIYGVLPYNWYTTNYGTVLGNSYFISKVLFPEDTSDVDPVKEMDDIYEFLVGERVYDRMAEEFGGFTKLET